MRAGPSFSVRWLLATALFGCLPCGGSAVAEQTVPMAPCGTTAEPGRGVAVVSQGNDPVRTIQPKVEVATTDDAVAAWLDKTMSQTRESPRLLRRDRADRPKNPSQSPCGPPVPAVETQAGRVPHRSFGIGSNPKPGQPPAGNVTITGIGRLMWPLLVVLGLIAFAALVVRKWLPRSSRFGPGGPINILTRHYLSPKQSLCLVRMGRRVLLIGVSPNCISAVAEIHDQEEAVAILSAAERSKPGSFSSTFARLTERDLKKEAAEDTEGEGSLASRQLASARANVRDLIGRIRALSIPAGGASGMGASAEPT